MKHYFLIGARWYLSGVIGCVLILSLRTWLGRSNKEPRYVAEGFLGKTKAEVMSLLGKPEIASETLWMYPKIIVNIPTNKSKSTEVTIQKEGFTVDATWKQAPPAGIYRHGPRRLLVRGVYWNPPNLKSLP